MPGSGSSRLLGAPTLRTIDPTHSSEQTLIPQSQSNSESGVKRAAMEVVSSRLLVGLLEADHRGLCRGWHRAYLVPFTWRRGCQIYIIGREANLLCGSLSPPFPPCDPGQGSNQTRAGQDQRQSRHTSLETSQESPQNTQTSWLPLGTCDLNGKPT